MTVRDAPPVDDEFDEAYEDDDAPDERFGLVNTVARWLVLAMFAFRRRDL